MRKEKKKAIDSAKTINGSEVIVAKAIAAKAIVAIAAAAIIRTGQQ